MRVTQAAAAAAGNSHSHDPTRAKEHAQSAEEAKHKKN
jgi:hypothetical protein